MSDFIREKPAPRADTMPEAYDEKPKDSSSLESPPDHLSYQDELNPKPVAIPWTKKGPMLIAILFLTLGSNFASASLAPMKSTIKEELLINNAQYGVISSASSLINAILPILTGIAIDYFGPNIGSIVASSFIFAGSLLTSAGASADSFSLMVVGQIVLGFGDSSIETAQSKLYTHLFFGDHLAAVYGLDIAMGRVFSLVARIVTVPIYQASSWEMAFWVPTVLCGVTLVINLVYVYFARRVAGAHVPTGRGLALASRAEDSTHSISVKSEVRYIGLSLTALPASFWFICVTQLLQAGVVGGWTGNSAEMIQVTRNKSKAAAGYTSSLSAVIPIVLTPALGAVFDQMGGRMYWVSYTAALWCVVFALMGFTTVNPLAPVLLSSLALVSNALPWIASIPLLVTSQAQIGTAFGVWKALNSCGSVIVDISVGAIQDRAVKDSNQYDNVFYFLIALKAVDVLYGLGYDLIDRRYFGSVLRLSEKKRVAKQELETEQERTSGLRAPILFATIVGLTVVLAMIIVAWVLFIKFAL